MSAASRRKGRRAEQELVAELRLLLPPYDWRRVAAATGGYAPKGAPDVDAPGSPFHVEAKRREKLSLGAALRQAREGAGARMPIVISRANREAWTVSLSLEDFAQLVSAVRADVRPSPTPCACRVEHLGGSEREHGTVKDGDEHERGEHAAMVPRRCSLVPSMPRSPLAPSLPPTVPASPSLPWEPAQAPKPPPPPP